MSGVGLDCSSFLGIKSQQECFPLHSTAIRSSTSVSPPICAYSQYFKYHCHVLLCIPSPCKNKFLGLSYTGFDLTRSIVCWQQSILSLNTLVSLIRFYFPALARVSTARSRIYVHEANRLVLSKSTTSPKLCGAQPYLRWWCWPILPKVKLQWLPGLAQSREQMASQLCHGIQVVAR